MPARVHPTKEQVRAYMRLRGGAPSPPPRPEEIRRQLGWYAGPGGDAMPSSASPLLLPGTIVQLATLLAVEWCFRASGISRSN